MPGSQNTWTPPSSQMIMHLSDPPPRLHPPPSPLRNNGKVPNCCCSDKGLPSQGGFTPRPHQHNCHPSAPQPNLCIPLSCAHTLASHLSTVHWLRGLTCFLLVNGTLQRTPLACLDAMPCIQSATWALHGVLASGVLHVAGWAHGWTDLNLRHRGKGQESEILPIGPISQTVAVPVVQPIGPSRPQAFEFEVVVMVVKPEERMKHSAIRKCPSFAAVLNSLPRQQREACTEVRQ